MTFTKVVSITAEQNSISEGATGSRIETSQNLTSNVHEQRVIKQCNTKYIEGNTYDKSRSQT